MKPDILIVLRHDTWGTDSKFLVELNATVQRDFTNLTADYQKILLEIGVMVDGLCKIYEFKLKESWYVKYGVLKYQIFL